MPKVSVNIACFNSAQFIGETMESVLSQTYGDLEVIVMDDGSTDSTGDIVKSFGDPRIKYFYKKNEGLSRTRNRALEVSSGEYIAFIDHDDMWLPRKLEKQISILERQEDVYLVYSNHFNLFPNGRREIVLKGPQPEGYAAEELLREYRIGLLNTVVRKKAFAELGAMFDEKLALCEDYDMFMRIVCRRRVAYVDEPLAVYRVHPGMQSIVAGKKFPEEFTYVMAKLKKIYPDIGEKYGHAIDHMASRVELSRAKIALLSNNRIEARRILGGIKGWPCYKFLVLYAASYLPFRLLKFFMRVNARYIARTE